MFDDDDKIKKNSDCPNSFIFAPKDYDSLYFLWKQS